MTCAEGSQATVSVGAGVEAEGLYGLRGSEITRNTHTHTHHTTIMEDIHSSIQWLFQSYREKC